MPIHFDIIQTIVEFLDKSRSAISQTHSTSSAPAPALTPATIAASTTCRIIIDDILHANTANPNTLRYVNARDDASLLALAKEVLPSLQTRQATLVGYVTQAEKGEIRVSDKVKKLWAEKLEATNLILAVLLAAEKPESALDEQAKANRLAFFKTARQTWETNLGGMLTQLNKEMVGAYTLGAQLFLCLWTSFHPFVTGDQFSIADLHLAGWLTRIVKLAGGTASDDGNTIVKKLEDHIGVGFKLPRDFVADQAKRDGGKDKQSKVAAFWDAVRERPSWRKVYAEGLF